MATSATMLQSAEPSAEQSTKQPIQQPMNEPPGQTARIPSPPMRAAMVLALLVAAVLALLIWARQQAAPFELAATGQRVPCVSYAPFRRAGHTPFDAALVVSPEQIEADLRLLATVSRCLRTYGVDHGLAAVPAIARTLGLQVVLGAWIGRDPVANAAQLDTALMLARTYPDVVTLLVVGNEVLLRRELSPAALAALLARARRETTVPVAYADVWEFWLRHAAALSPHVDVVAAHVLPYWEDEPVAIEQAVNHVQAVAERLREAFGPVPVFIAETGWPAYGRQRGQAQPGTLAQVRFVRELLGRGLPDAPAAAWPAWNLIEAFDQPWKRSLEGAVGGYWGLFDAQGRLRVALSGPVPPDPAAWQIPVALLTGGLAGLLWAWAGKRRAERLLGRQGSQWVFCAALALIGATVAAMGLLQWRMLVMVSRDSVDWVLAGTLSLLAAACALAASWQLGLRLAGARVLSPRPGVYAMTRSAADSGLRWLVVAQAGLLFGMAVQALVLVFDGRYRPLIWPMTIAPVVLLGALAWLGERLAADAREERFLGGICGLAAPVLWWNEGWANGQAWLSGALGLALLAVVLPGARAHGLGPGGRVQVERTKASPPSKTAGAQSPAE